MGLFSNVFKSVFGGGTSQPAGYQGPGDMEQNFAQGQQANLQNTYDQQNSAYNTNAAPASDATNLFNQHLKQFMDVSSQGTSPTDDQMKQATNFVDQTYTNPTQNAINQYNSQFQDQQNAKAASLGRNPNADIATQQAIYGEGERNAINLQANRGAQIQQTAQGLNNENYGRLGQGITAGLQGSNFLNGLTQQAFTNRLNTLNGQSQLSNYYQRNRQNLNQAPQAQAGIIGQATSAVSQLGGLGVGVAKLASAT